MNKEIIESSNDKFDKIANTMIGAVIIVAGITLLLRLGKVMVSDLREMEI